MRIRWWWFWIVVVAVASGPWFGVVRQPQWWRVTWIPFHGFEDKPSDMAVNFLLLVPFGWSFARTRPGANGTVQTMIAAAAISLAVETPQLFYRLRNPSATDVVMAIFGAAAGSLAAQAFHRRDTRGAPRRSEAGDPRGSE